GSPFLMTSGSEQWISNTARLREAYHAAAEPFFKSYGGMLPRTWTSPRETWPVPPWVNQRVVTQGSSPRVSLPSSWWQPSGWRASPRELHASAPQTYSAASGSSHGHNGYRGCQGQSTYSAVQRPISQGHVLTPSPYRAASAHVSHPPPGSPAYGRDPASPCRGYGVMGRSPAPGIHYGGFSAADGTLPPTEDLTWPPPL
ncbi:unnamed protein product, partial [Polarella glacialis]